jgi:DNA-binding NarL/FixJ family response regulator
LRDVLRRWGDVEIVGVCPSSVEAARTAERVTPDVLLLARGSNPAADSQAIAAARAAAPRCRVVLVEEAGRAGADDGLDVDWRVKPTVGPAGLMRGLWALQPQTAAANSSADKTAGRPGRPLISGREYEVLRAVCDGLPNKDLARRLGISESTVKNHLSNIYRRTKVTGRTQLVLWAIERGLGAGPPPRRGDQ